MNKLHHLQAYMQKRKYAPGTHFTPLTSNVDQLLKDLTPFDRNHFLEQAQQTRDIFYTVSTAYIGRNIKHQKTKTSYRFPLLSTAMGILSRYSDHPQCVEEGKLFPILSNRKMNAYIKEIADV